MAQEPGPLAGTTAHIAGAIRYFCGPESSWTMGQAQAEPGEVD